MEFLLHFFILTTFFGNGVIEFDIQRSIVKIFCSDIMFSIMNFTLSIYS